MELGVVGVGYVGLTAAVALASKGHTVHCVDADPEKIRRLAAGQPTFFEPGMGPYLARGLRSGRLRFTDSLAEGVARAELVLIAVSTPSDAHGRADVSALYQVAEGLAETGRSPVPVVIKSTVPVGTGDALEAYLKERTGRVWPVVSNPEFMREASALGDYLEPDRIIIGASDSEAAALVRRLYASFAAPVLMVDRRTAELTKYAANGFLAAKISYINEIADLCERLNVDVTQVSRGVGLDHRIGPHGLAAGLGYGGSCFPKDVAALITQFRDQGCEPRLLDAVQRINQDRRSKFLALVRSCFPTLKGNLLAVWGLAFKPGTDDLRQAPALDIVPALQAEGAALRVYDPAVGARAARRFPGVAVADSPVEAARGAHGVLVLTEWEEFRQVSLGLLRAVMTRPLVIDGRNVFTPGLLKAAGFEYRALGRG